MSLFNYFSFFLKIVLTLKNLLFPFSPVFKLLLKLSIDTEPLVQVLKVHINLIGLNSLGPFKLSEYVFELLLLSLISFLLQLLLIHSRSTAVLLMRNLRIFILGLGLLHIN